MPPTAALPRPVTPPVSVSRPEPPLASLRQISVVERASASLRGLIDRLQPGAQLPTEGQLVASLGIGRTTLREALARLRAEGLLVSRQGKGVFVAELSARAVVRVDLGAASAEARLAALFELRRSLEAGAAELAARRRSPADLRAMRQALKTMGRPRSAQGVAGEHDAGALADVAFHTAIAQASGNPLFVQFFEFVQQQLIEARRTAWRNSAQIGLGSAPAQREHQALYDAIEAGDATAARRRATEHLEHAAARLGLERI